MPGLLFLKADITENNNNPLCASEVLMGMVLMWLRLGGFPPNNNRLPPTPIKKDKRIYEQFKKYQQAIDDFNLEECIMHYEEGFRFGVLLGLDLVGYIKE